MYKWRVSQQNPIVPNVDKKKSSSDQLDYIINYIYFCWNNTILFC